MIAIMPTVSSASDSPSALIPVESLMDQIWQKYDLDRDGCLNNVEIKNLVKIIPHRVCRKSIARNFLKA